MTNKGKLDEINKILKLDQQKFLLFTFYMTISNHPKVDCNYLYFMRLELHCG